MGAHVNLLKCGKTIMVNVTIYSKKDCHLCHIAKEILLKIQHEIPFSLTEIDIEKDKNAFEKYKCLIPVLEIDGEIAFNYRINEDKLKMILMRKALPQCTEE
ncbi:MAG: glutaredoxin family protein [Candidatus Methanoperedens sp.]|nr:glutaredoxin family protein [Candidatus Methanoperedens sp.]MCZ7369800.1 glutaredoxin family protein [Candidatus Methanoperedens sp.]